MEPASAFIDEKIKQLGDCSLRLKYGTSVIHDSRQVRVCERNSSKRRGSQNVAGRRLAILAEEKARLRI